MQPGSLIVLAVEINNSDRYVSAKTGCPLPEKEAIYTISEGPVPLELQGRVFAAIRIEEFGDWYYNSTGFKEVQPPMADLNQLFEPSKQVLCKKEV